MVLYVILLQLNRYINTSYVISILYVIFLCKYLNETNSTWHNLLQVAFTIIFLDGIYFEQIDTEIINNHEPI